MPSDSRVPPSSDESPVRQWIAHWQNGIDREENFRRIFNQHYPLVLSFFTRKGFPTEESQDLAQEAFLRVHRSLETFRGESSFKTWLFKICMSLFQNTLRAQSTRKRGAPEVSLDGLMDVHGAGEAGSEGGFLQTVEKDQLEGLLSAEKAEILTRAFQDMPSQMRRCVELRVGRDLKYREIADIQHVSIDTVKAHLFQARQFLKKKLSDYFDPPDKDL